MHHRTVSGLIKYTSKKPERLDEVRGQERFTFTHHGDGSTTLRAICEIEEPDPSVLRDVIFSVDPSGAPRDCFVRLTLADQFAGAGFFRFGPDWITCDSYGPTIGSVSQRISLERPIDGFGTHPIVADGYFLGRQNFGGEKRKTFHLWLPSPDHRGATPPLLAPAKIDGLYLGDESVTTPAGTFACRHLQFIDPGDGGLIGTHPRYDLWVTADEDAIFVKGGVGGYMQTWYELVELRRTL
jgi:hypothetical protein